MPGVRFDLVTVGCLRSRRWSPESASHPLAALPGWFAEMAASNPAARDADPAACILWLGDEPAARISLIAAPLAVAGREVPCHWGMDFASNERFRARGAGVLLIRELLGILHARGEIYAAYGSSEEAVRVYRGLGFVHLGRAPRYLWPLRSRNILDAHLDRRLAAVLRPVVDSVLAGASIVQVARLSNGCVFEARREFDAEVDRALRTDVPRYGCVVDSSLLNWRVAAARANKRRRVELRYLKSGPTRAVSGYVITRLVRRERIEGHPYRNVTVLSLLDHFVTPGDDGLAHAIVGHLLREGRERGVDVVEIVTSDRRLLTALRRNGFRRVGGHDVAFSPPAALAGQLPTCVEDWRITNSTGDGFLI